MSTKSYKILRITISNRVTKSISKTFYWFVINSFFGLCPVLIAILFYLINPVDYALNPRKIIEEGTILFFCAAICASTMVDYILSKKNLKKHIEFIIYAAPFCLLLFISLVFAQLFFSDGKQENLETLLVLQNITIAATLLYVFILKTTVFLSE